MHPGFASRAGMASKNGKILRARAAKCARLERVSGRRAMLGGSSLRGRGCEPDIQTALSQIIGSWCSASGGWRIAVEKSEFKQP